MMPPVCSACGRDFDPFDGGGTVAFADHVPLPDGMPGHPTGTHWFCARHLAKAKELKGQTSSEALAKLRVLGFPRRVAALQRG